MATDRIINQAVDNEQYISQPLKALSIAVKRLYRTNLWRVIAVGVMAIAAMFGLGAAVFGVSLLNFIRGTEVSSASGATNAVGFVVLIAAVLAIMLGSVWLRLVVGYLVA